MSSDVSPAQIAEGKDEKEGAHVHNCRALTVNATAWKTSEFVPVEVTELNLVYRLFKYPNVMCAEHS